MKPSKPNALLADSMNTPEKRRVDQQNITHQSENPSNALRLENA
jgi:hypothetical protein